MTHHFLFPAFLTLAISVTLPKTPVVTGTHSPPAIPPVQTVRPVVPDAPPLSGAELQASLSELKRKALFYPIAGADPEQIKGSFYETHFGSMHRASDILAPRNTPIHAVEDGTVAKLFTSQAGGLTIYQYDPTNKYVYYYAHLQSYAPGLADGQRLMKGQVIGFVGTSGNAPPNTPHLHFAIGKLMDNGKWWHTQPIDPYAVFSKLNSSALTPPAPTPPSPTVPNAQPLPKRAPGPILLPKSTRLFGL